MKIIIISGAFIFAKIFTMTELRAQIENAWDNRELLKDSGTQKAIREVINLLDLGRLRCAEPNNDGWQINEWVKKRLFYTFPFKKWRF